MLHFIVQNLSTLIALYNSTGRRYHNLDHIHFCLARMEEAKLQEEFKEFTELEWGALEIAIWFHDAIYNPEAQMVKKGYSETESINLMYGLSMDYFKEPYRPGAMFKPHLSEALMIAEKLIAATAEHGQVPSDKLTALMVDIDLSSLALPWHKFKANTDRVVDEYALNRDRAMIELGNAQFLKALREGSPRLFHTDWGFEKFENNAHANIYRRCLMILPKDTIDEKH